MVMGLTRGRHLVKLGTTWDSSASWAASVRFGYTRQTGTLAAGGGTLMFMALNIKQEATLAELKELSERTGNSMASEVATAVHERLERLQRKKEEKIARIMRLTDDTAARWPEHLKDADPTTFLYDDKTGMPA